MSSTAVRIRPFNPREIRVFNFHAGDDAPNDPSVNFLKPCVRIKKRVEDNKNDDDNNTNNDNNNPLSSSCFNVEFIEYNCNPSVQKYDARKTFTGFDHVFWSIPIQMAVPSPFLRSPNATQEDVYRDFAAPIIADFITNMTNSCIVSYGQTGVGKTSSLFRLLTSAEASEEERKAAQGILFRAIEDMVSRVTSLNNTNGKSNHTTSKSSAGGGESTTTTKTSFKLGYRVFEKYREKVKGYFGKKILSHDFIDPKFEKSEDGDYIQMVVSPEVDWWSSNTFYDVLKDPEQVTKELDYVAMRRLLNETKMGQMHSRTFTIVEFKLTKIVTTTTTTTKKAKHKNDENDDDKNDDDDQNVSTTNNTSSAILKIVDSAGSERIKFATDLGPAALEEQQRMQLSIKTFARCFRELADNAQNLFERRKVENVRVVSTFNSALTSYLEDVFFGRMKLHLFGFISPSSVNTAETLDVLNLIQDVKTTFSKKQLVHRDQNTSEVKVIDLKY